MTLSLEAALHQIAAEGGLNPDELIAYAAEDQVGGRDTTPDQWTGMSVFACEGQILYALVRALRPTLCVEVGVDEGGTTTHILAALEANAKGKLWSVDIRPAMGEKVPEALRHRWTLVAGDALAVKLPKKADFVFEDGEHSLAFTQDVLARLKALNPRLIISHDAVSNLYMPGVFEVLPAFKSALGVDSYVLVEPSRAGLAYWWNPERAR